MAFIKIPKEILTNALLLKEYFYYDSGKLYRKYSTSGSAMADTEVGTIVITGGLKYKRTRLLGKNLAVHKMIYALHYNRWPDKALDHINHDTLDNRIENLREVTNNENQKNRLINKNNPSGYSGVRKNKKGIWVATISHQGKRIFLGSSKDLEIAKILRKQGETEFNYHPNHGKTYDQINKQ